MRILAIETSCDETGIALIEGGPSASSGRLREPRVIANLVRSQIETHRPYGGVVPNLAKREHKKALPLLLKQLQETYNLELKTVNLIAVTQGPGLSPCLWEGINFAKDLASKLDLPLVGVNHLKGHIYITFPFEEGVEYPILALIVSGGHTELVFSKKLGEYKILGRTRDDAAGEAFDKVAKLLGLAYPGGPEISRLAERGDAERFSLPRPMIDSGDFNFSFAGLKTAVVYLVKGVPASPKTASRGGGPHDKPLELTSKNVADLAASFQKAAVDVLVEKTIRAARKTNPKTVIVGGGVAANELLRKEFTTAVGERLPGMKLILPDRKLTTDNALMIALTAWYEREVLRPQKELQALPNLKIDQN